MNSHQLLSHSPSLLSLEKRLQREANDIDQKIIDDIETQGQITRATLEILLSFLEHNAQRWRFTMPRDQVLTDDNRPLPPPRKSVGMRIDLDEMTSGKDFDGGLAA